MYLILYVIGIFMSFWFYLAYFNQTAFTEPFIDNVMYSVGLSILWIISIPYLLGQKFGQLLERK
jgi:hypothetical protein